MPLRQAAFESASLYSESRYGTSATHPRARYSLWTIIERSFDNGLLGSVNGTVGTVRPLAFVDVETTGLSPAVNRIAEIGVVTVDGDRIERWTTLVKARERRRTEDSDVAAMQDTDPAPSFGDIASGLAQRLAGRLLVAHNARFDHAFLRAEFDRVGIAFEPAVLCSVMLSRRLYPDFQHHDLDSLAERHGLRVEARHRALPDADLVWQLWQVIHRQCRHDLIGDTIEGLLAGPVLPPHLDPSLIDRLPQTPGAYVFHGEDNVPLVVGAAGNLKLHILNYFRIDQATDKALEYSHRITSITWRATRGMLGAQLHAAALDCVHFAHAKRKMNAGAFTWQFLPDALPCVAVVPLSDRRSPRLTESFGIFRSERKACNALVRLGAKHGLCHCLLGVFGFSAAECPACPVDQPTGACVGRINRKKQLMRVFGALEPLRIPAWPHRGPVGIRERADIHVIDHWRFLGTAQSESELYGVLECDPGDFDPRLYLLLDRTFSRLPPTRIVDLSAYECRAELTRGHAD
jgi:DNA polymerase-3 subunit epsilon